jgi:hypothetical protein
VHSQCRRWVIFVGGNQGSPSISVRSTSNSDRKFKALASEREVPGSDICTAVNSNLFDHLVRDS